VGELNGSRSSFVNHFTLERVLPQKKAKAAAASAETASLLKRALAIREQALGPDHPETIKIVEALAVGYAHHGDHARTEPFLKRLIAVREKRLRPDHADVTDLVAVLAQGAMDERKYHEAIPLLKRLIAARNAHGKDAAAHADPLEAVRLPADPHVVRCRAAKRRP
jgi:hypothetical protein